MQNVNASTNTSGSYLNKIKHAKILDREEFNQLFAKALNGDQTAREKCTESNLRLVLKIANEYRGRSGFVEIEDLIQAGNMGLLMALNRYQNGTNSLFPAYAAFLIRGEILKTIHEFSRTVRIPPGTAQDINKLYWHSGELAAQIGRTPTEEEIIENFTKISGKTRKRVEKLLALSNRRFTRSMNETLSSENDLTIEETLSSEDIEKDLLQKLEIQNLSQFIETLNPKQKKVIKMRLQNMTFEEIGEKLGISKQGVQQLEDRSITALKKILEKEQT
ncbi:sigma-70 family RNA polymerase sigma factor [Candidatus Peregrinibacteria bacterium]|nr:sigma-70 family RNA polymerase sigma factor [Candidatus Peregrinibacteria bacterium]